MSHGRAVAAIAASYAIASVPVAYLAGRWRGVDVRDVGSGNVGASNIGESVSKGLMVPVGLAQIAQGLAGPLLARAAGQPSGVQVAAGVAAIAAHDWNPWLRFQGGRGVGPAIGFLLAMAPRDGLPAFVAVAVAGVPFKASAQSIAAGLVAAPVAAYAGGARRSGGAGLRRGGIDGAVEARACERGAGGGTAAAGGVVDAAGVRPGHPGPGGVGASRAGRGGGAIGVAAGAAAFGSTETQRTQRVVFLEGSGGGRRRPDASVRSGESTLNVADPGMSPVGAPSRCTEKIPRYARNDRRVRGSRRAKRSPRSGRRPDGRRHYEAWRGDRLPAEWVRLERHIFAR